MTGGNMTGLNLNCRNLACNKLNLNLVIAVVTSNWLWAWNNAKWKKGWVNTFWRENLHLQFPPEWLLNKKKHVRNSVVPPCITVQPSKSCCLKLSVIFDMFFFFWWFIYRSFTVSKQKQSTSQISPTASWVIFRIQPLR